VGVTRIVPPPHRSIEPKPGFVNARLDAAEREYLDDLAARFDTSVSAALRIALLLSLMHELEHGEAQPAPEDERPDEFDDDQVFPSMLGDLLERRESPRARRRGST
jgi:hypothetical protein